MTHPENLPLVAVVSLQRDALIVAATDVLSDHCGWEVGEKCGDEWNVTCRCCGPHRRLANVLNHMLCQEPDVEEATDE